MKGVLLLAILVILAVNAYTIDTVLLIRANQRIYDIQVDVYGDTSDTTTSTLLTPVALSYPITPWNVQPNCSSGKGPFYDLDSDECGDIEANVQCAVTVTVTLTRVTKVCIRWSTKAVSDCYTNNTYYWQQILCKCVNSHRHLHFDVKIF